MNRRTLLAGMAAMVPATAMGQEATPTEGPEPAAKRVLRTLLYETIRDGDYTNLAGMTGSGLDANALIESMTKAHGYARDGLDIHMIASSGNQAMAYATVTDGSGTDYALLIHLETDPTGHIASYRWSAIRGD